MNCGGEVGVYTGRWCGRYTPPNPSLTYVIHAGAADAVAAVAADGARGAVGGEAVLLADALATARHLHRQVAKALIHLAGAAPVVFGAGRAVAGAALVSVANALVGAADRRARLQRVLGAVGAPAGAPLLDVAVARGGAADGRRRLVRVVRAGAPSPESAGISLRRAEAGILALERPVGSASAGRNRKGEKEGQREKTSHWAGL